MRYPSCKDARKAQNVLREMKRQGVDSEVLDQLQSVANEFENAGRQQ